MPAIRRAFAGLRPAFFIFIALVCLASACAPTLPAATPTATLIPATAAPAVTATPAATLTPAPTAMPAANATATTADLGSVLDADLQKSYQAGTFNGAVLIAQNGRVILNAGYGVADLAKDTPITPQTKFRIYQLTMQFTAMATMLLQGRGKLSVQDGICKYLTDCPSSWQPVTIHQLLAQTSGIVDTWDIHARGSLTSTAPLEKMIADAKALPLAFQPGTQSEYDNLGYILLGKIIEAASGQTYQDFLQQNIFQPLGMTNTGYDDGHVDAAVEYVGYGTSDTLAPVNIWVPFSAAGLYSTVGDLYLWDQALETHKLVPQSAIDAIFTSYAPAADFFAPGFGYGYGGWLIGTDNHRRVFMGVDNVQTGGFAGFVARYPDDKTTLVILSNSQNTLIYNTAIDLSQKLFAK